VQRYRVSLQQSDLASSSINVRLCAIRKLATEAADNRLLAPDIAAAIGRVKGVKRQGIRTGNWLTRADAEQIIALSDPTTNKGRRDRALLCILLGCGLRREELARLTVEHIQQRDGRWALVDLIGKGQRIRTVPMPGWAKVAVDSWLLAAQITSGRLLRAVNKGDRVTGPGITAQSIFEIVETYGRLIDRNCAARSPPHVRETRPQGP
jgi:site-specific recombinase XerD